MDAIWVRRLAAAAVFGAAVLAPSAAASAAPAEVDAASAAPSCDTRYWQNEFWVTCNSGGEYRAKARCYKHGHSSYVVRYGAWKKPNQGISIATCLSSEEVSSGEVERR